MAILQARGKITMLRVHELGSRFGPGDDQINVEAVVQIDSQPGKSFGLQLRDNNDLPANSGMLDLLRDAMTNDFPVTLEFDLDSGKKNGMLIRTILTR